MEAKKERYYYLDVLRVLACFLVIMEHVPMIRYKECFHQGSTAFAVFLYFISFAGDLFFMITGALLLPVKSSMREFLKRRMKVLLIPLAIWSIIYILEAYISKANFLDKFISILVQPADVSLWFLYALVAIYVFMPILTKFIEAAGKRYIEYYLILWILSSFISYQHGIFLYDPQISHAMFSSFYNVMGYVVLGYYLHNWPIRLDSVKKCFSFYGFFMLLLVSLFCFEYYFQSRYGLTYSDHLDTFNCEVSPNAICFCIIYFIFFQNVTTKTIQGDGKKHLFLRALVPVGTCTYGIYLMHMLVFRRLVFPLTRDYLGGSYFMTDVVITGVIGFIFCLVFSFIIYKTPLSKWLIGRG